MYHTYSYIVLALLSSLILLGEGKNNASPQNIVHKLTSPSPGKNKHVHSDIPKKSSKVLVLDVDNTLYNEAEIKLRAGFGIEDQIISRTDEFGKKHFNLSPEECYSMYRKYGSTVEGLRHKLEAEGKSKVEINTVMRMYYNEVYDGIDMSCLISPSHGESNRNTGYSHDKSVKARRILVEILKGIKEPIFLASNSPKSHVMKVVNTLGLGDIAFAGVLTPDSIRDAEEIQDLPTKINPSAFFHPILKKYDSSVHDVILLDDSINNLEKAYEIGIKGLRVNGQSGQTIREALSTFMDLLDPEYKFSDVKYLESKNEVDLVSINAEVWGKLAVELSQMTRNSNIIRIVDLGAGLLSMLKMILEGGGGKESLINLLDNPKSIKAIEYIAYESNEILFDQCYSHLKSMGFAPIKKQNEDENVLRTRFDGIEIIVKLRMKNFSLENISGKEHFPHLLIGCCFADLFDPDELAATLISFLQICSIGGGVDSGDDQNLKTLVYFPITFSGTTQFSPSKPFGLREHSKKKIPSDTLAFQKYAHSLVDQHGHNLDPDRIVEAMGNIQGIFLTSGPSEWNIDPQSNAYLWDTMMYFFATSSGPSMISEWDFNGWLQRARYERPKIVVSNKDLLFALSPSRTLLTDVRTNRDDGAECLVSNQGEQVEEISFQAPYNVTKIIKAKDQVDLKPGQIEVKSIYSLISSGTELKIFKGMFEDAALDVNIKGMAEETMKYPLSYGYSLVGTVTRCATDIADAQDIIGKTVFTFSPHSSHVITDRDSVQLVPNDISPEDAIFMPSVETALSIVHDANMRIGEKVVVFGQGLIGLLVNAILSRSCEQYHFDGEFNTVTAVDTLSDRMAMASKMGASQVLMPNEVHNAAPFDVSVEVSGNARALQAAIDNTKDGGRIIVGSWYGNSDIKLKLGIDFHRSHKTIKTSQVSTIAGELASLWSKERRFELTWKLVKMLKPSRLITKKVSLDEAQHAYELLDKGKEIAIAFMYS